MVLYRYITISRDCALPFEVMKIVYDITLRGPIGPIPFQLRLILFTLLLSWESSS